MTKTEIKEMVQGQLLRAMQRAFDEIADTAHEQKGEITNEASAQFARVEKLFGYEPYSFTRGT